MTTIDFFRQVWPDAGIYCLATPAVKGWKHHVFRSIEDAVTWVGAHGAQQDTFFAVHTLRKEKHWNDTKINKLTGELGRFEVRSHPNMLEAKSFFVDLDVGPEADKYPDQLAALVGLKNFCTAVKIPAPTVTSSGRGVHAFWPLDTVIASEQWRSFAFKLHQLIRHHGLLVDHSKVTDQSAVLRVPGTLHLKDRSDPRPVRVLRSGKVTAQADFLKALDDAIIRAGITQRMAPIFKGPPPEDLLGSNLEKDYGPPPKMRALLKACAQMRYVAGTKGDVPEPVWYHGMIGVMQFVDEGREWVHRLSSGYARYSRDETDSKLDQWPGGVSSCAKVAEKNGDTLCEGCTFAKSNRNPIWAARQMDVAAAPIAAFALGAHTTTLTVPDPPWPFKRLADGRIGFVSTNKDGDEEHKILLDHDLYPLRRLSNTVEGREFQLWRAVLPRSGVRDFMLEADAIYDTRKLLSALSHNGVYIPIHSIKEIGNYMVAYIKRLQAEADAEAQMTHLGWTADKMRFILPDRILQPDGSCKSASLNPGAARVAESLGTEGTLQRQIELLRFYNSPMYLPNQFFILCALGAPLFRYTDHHGVVVNAQGDSGVSKSTTLYAGASCWGDPLLYPINGTNTGMTTLARQNRIAVLANLPVCIDEITHMDLKQAKDMALAISQPGVRKGLDRNGVEKAGVGGIKSTIMLSTANISLHALLSSDNAAGTAGSMRIFEIKFRLGSVHKKIDADNFLHELKQNYGHIGPVLMAYVVKHSVTVERRMREVMAEIDTAAALQPSERFWTAAAATAIVTAEISFELGLLSYTPESVRRWVLNKQIPDMRGVVKDEYSTPEGLLSDFLDRHHGHIILTEGNRVQRAPHGELVAHYDTEKRIMHISKTAFKNYCMKIGANSTTTLASLFLSRIVTNKKYRTTLGRGTEHAKVQSWTFAIDMDHPEVAGVHVDLVTSNGLIDQALERNL